MKKSTATVAALSAAMLTCLACVDLVLDFLASQDSYSENLESAEPHFGARGSLVRVLPPSASEIHSRFDIDLGDIWIKFRFRAEEFAILRDRLQTVHPEDIGSLDLRPFKQTGHPVFPPSWWPVELTESHLRKADDRFPFFVGTYSAVTGWRKKYYFFIDAQAGRGYCYTPGSWGQE